MSDDFFSQNFVIKFMHIIAKTFFILAWNAYLCNPNCGVMIAWAYWVTDFISFIAIVLFPIFMVLLFFIISILYSSLAQHRE